MTMYRNGRVAALSAALAAVLLTGVVSAVDMPGANADPVVASDRVAITSPRTAALMPVAKPDSITLWPKHEYNLTRRVLKNDVATVARCGSPRCWATATRTPSSGGTRAG